MTSQVDSGPASEPAQRRVVEFYQRPGCPSCRRLRRGLRSTGLPVREVNIWADRDAAARVRAVAAGNETVPTVFVGTRALVNPTADQVVTAVREELPELARAAERPAQRFRRSRKRR